MTVLSNYYWNSNLKIGYLKFLSRRFLCWPEPKYRPSEYPAFIIFSLKEHMPRCRAPSVHPISTLLPGSRLPELLRELSSGSFHALINHRVPSTNSTAARTLRRLSIHFRLFKDRLFKALWRVHGVLESMYIRSTDYKSPLWVAVGKWSMMLLAFWCRLEICTRDLLKYQGLRCRWRKFVKSSSIPLRRRFRF